MQNKIIIFFIVLLLSSILGHGNNNLYQPDSIISKKAIKITNGLIYGASYIGLYHLWYKNYDLSSFHFFNDSKEWLQIDKAGHIFSAYYLANFQTETLEYTGLNHKKAVITASAISFLYLSSIEIFDGFSSEWGASISDLSANLIGSGLFLIQDLYFENITMIIKYSYNFNSTLNVRTDILGNSFTERLLKDYNSQTYWLSANFGDLFVNSSLLKYINPAVGYGASGMTAGMENPPQYGNYDRNRQYYLSLDIDFKGINTNIKWLDFIIHHLNFLKFPMPTVEYSNGNWKFHPVYF